jgi:hypothetical protein
MRILSALALLGVLGVTSLAYADAGLGCGGDDTTEAPIGQDMSVPRDLTMPMRDLDRGDVRREKRTRRRAAGAGMIVLSGLGVAGVALTRRRVRA